jgi:hypothetical protein
MVWLKGARSTLPIASTKPTVKAKFWTSFETRTNYDHKCGVTYRPSSVPSLISRLCAFSVF